MSPPGVIVINVKHVNEMRVGYFIYAKYFIWHSRIF